MKVWLVELGEHHGPYERSIHSSLRAAMEAVESFKKGRTGWKEVTPRYAEVLHLDLNEVDDIIVTSMVVDGEAYDC